MKKFLRLIVHNRRTIVKSLVVVTVAVVLYEMAHNVATLDRGYEAIGGEVFVPLLIIFAEDIWGMIKEPFKAVRND